MVRKEKQHHLDRRAHRLIEQINSEGDGDDLVSTWELAEWLGMSPVWLENGRRLGFGPKFVRTGSRRCRYRRSDILAWLDERTRRPGVSEAPSQKTEKAAST